MSFWPMKETTELRPLKYLARFNPEVLPEDTNPNFEFDYIDIGSVTLEEGIRHKEVMRFEAAPSRARKPVRSGDVIVSTVRTYLKAVARIDETHNGAIVSTGFAVLRPNADVDAGYLYRLCQANPFVADVEAGSTGVSYPAINPSALAAIKVPLPDLATQKATAVFLGRETSRIDQLIAKKERLAALLEEKLENDILRAVTLGIDPDVKLVPENELEWTTHRPIHWKLVRLKHFFRENTKYCADGQGTLLSLRMREGLIPHNDVSDKEMHSIDLINYKKVLPGQIVMNRMRAAMGLFGLADRAGIVSPDYSIFDVSSEAHAAYFLRLFKTEPMMTAFRILSKGLGTGHSGFMRLNSDSFGRIRVAVPALEEQKLISKYIQGRIAQITNLQGKTEQSIDRLKEIRAALITAAVAGQIDIREKLPAVISAPDRDRFRLVVAAEIIHQHRSNPKFGRVKLQKELYLAEVHLGISELQGNYFRQAAGPLDRALIEETERAVEAASFYRVSQANGAGTTVTYTPLTNAGRHNTEFKSLLGPRAEAVGGLIGLLRDFGTETVEAITTLYAVWNDALMDGQRPDDSTIIKGVLTEWHAEKEKKFKDSDLRHWLGWMKRNGLTPRGQGPRTAHTMTRDLFA